MLCMSRIHFVFLHPCFFFKVFHAEYGAQYDNDLQTLFSEFLYRLGHLLPVPDLDQVSHVLLFALFL